MAFVRSAAETALACLKPLEKRQQNQSPSAKDFAWLSLPYKAEKAKECWPQYLPISCQEYPALSSAEAVAPDQE